jgi:hypothetical protein
VGESRREEEGGRERPKPTKSSQEKELHNLDFKKMKKKHSQTRKPR